MVPRHLALLALLLPLQDGQQSSGPVLLWSKQSDRGQALALEGSTVGGAIYIFAVCPADTLRVSFYLDDPDRTAPPARTENGAPFDFQGGTEESAGVFDTSTLIDGAHTLTAELLRKDGETALVRAAFRVGNGPPALRFEPTAIELALPYGGEKSFRVGVSPSRGEVGNVSFSNLPAWLTVENVEGARPLGYAFKASAIGCQAGTHQGTIHASAAGFAPALLPVRMTIADAPTLQLLFSSASNRGSSGMLDGAVVRGDVFVFVLPEKDIRSVAFHLDDPRFEAKPVNTETRAPFDLMGGTEAAAQPFDSLSLRDGHHSISARIALEGGGKVELWAMFQVSNLPSPSDKKLAEESTRSPYR